MGGGGGGIELTFFTAAHMVLGFALASNSAGNTAVFWLLVNSACTDSWLSFSNTAYTHP